jgi:FkbM family methyltransferase
MKIPRFIGDLPVVILRGPARGCWWTLYPSTSYWRLGGHEARVDAVLRDLGDLTGKTAWDCGAHFGIYALRFALAVGPQGQVAAFEPDPVSFRKLQRHIRLNGLKNVVCLEAAASDGSGEQVMVVNQRLGSTTSHLPYHGEVISADSTTVSVKRISADELVREGVIRCPDVIKLDVEGHGGEVMQGAIETLAQSKPAILFAVHSPQELAGIKRVADRLGYEVWNYGVDPPHKAHWGDCYHAGPFLLTCRPCRHSNRQRSNNLE